LRVLVLAAILASLSCAKVAPAVDPTAARKASALTDEAYALERDGRNGPALARLIDAGGLLGASGRDRASNLDDQASVQLRLGRADEARRLLDSALAILRALPPAADDPLPAGVAFRRRIVDALAAHGVACAEPEEPPANPALPYYPVIADAQRALLAMGPAVASCTDEPAKPVTVTLVVTGDGRIVLVETPGPLAGTPAEACVRDGIARASAGLSVPRFRACFRPFNLPFRIGKEG
jgi:hypothetical protein